MKNTKVTYIYRDVNNFKAMSEVVFEGTVPEERIQEIFGLNELIEFIPEEVGLTRLKLSSASGLLTEDDVALHELWLKDICETDDEPTDTRTFDEFLDAIKQAPRNEVEAFRAMFAEGMQVYRSTEDDKEAYSVLNREQAIAYRLTGEMPEGLEIIPMEV